MLSNKMIKVRGCTPERTLSESWFFYCLDWDELMLDRSLSQQQHPLNTESPVHASGSHGKSHASQEVAQWTLYAVVWG